MLNEAVGRAERVPKACCDTISIWRHGHPELF